MARYKRAEEKVVKILKSHGKLPSLRYQRPTRFDTGRQPLSLRLFKPRVTSAPPVELPKISSSVWHTVPGAGSVPLLKYAFRASAVHAEKPDCEVC